MDENPHAPWGRLKDVTTEGSVNRLLGDTYGDVGRYIQPFRNFAQYSNETPKCARQITADIKYRPDQPLSPVNALIVVIVVYSAYYESEEAFSKLASAHKQQKATEAVQKGGTPEL